MKIKSIKQTKTADIIKHLLSFVLLMGFVTSTIDKTNINSKSKRETILQELNLEDMSTIENKNKFLFLSSMVENHRSEKIENFNETLTYKLIEKIYLKVIDQNYENNSMKEINEILDIIMTKISEISEHNINNDFFFQAIYYLIGIYSNYKKNDLNFENFNKKIIPIIKKIHNKENNEYKNDINNSSKYKFLNDCINLFKILLKNDNFFLI